MSFGNILLLPLDPYAHASDSEIFSETYEQLKHMANDKFGTGRACSARVYRGDGIAIFWGSPGPLDATLKFVS